MARVETPGGGLTRRQTGSTFPIMNRHPLLAAAALLAAPLVSCEPRVQQTASVERTGMWIDVRTTEEFSSGHLDGALNMPHETIGREIAAAVPDKNAEIHLYCRSGRRAGIAKQTLEDMGYRNVTNEGGYEALKGR